MPRKNFMRKISRTPFQSSCADKRHYQTEPEARAAADLAMISSLTLQLSVYQCPLCGGWHLTSRHDSDTH